MSEGKGNKPQSLCWRCRRAIIGGCPWVDEWEPVPGWEAIPDSNRTTLVAGSLETYTVLSCPLLKCDAPDHLKKPPGQREYMVNGLNERIYHAKPIEDNDAAIMLAAAIIKQACEDWLTYWRLWHVEERKELETWFRSDYFRRISDLNPDNLIRALKRLVKEKEKEEAET